MPHQLPEAGWRERGLLNSFQNAMSSQLSHYLHEQDEAIGEIRKDLSATGDNLATGNAYLDSAARHSRDFRIFILTFLLVASFSLLFLDWYYD